MSLKAEYSESKSWQCKNFKFFFFVYFFYHLNEDVITDLAK